MSRHQALHRFLLTLSQPWFSPDCEDCNQLNRIKLKNGAAAVCRLIEQGKPCEKVNEMNQEQFMESIAEKFATIDERNRLFTISCLDSIFEFHLEKKLLAEAKDLLTAIALDAGEARGEQLRALFNEEISSELPDLQNAIVRGLLKDL